MSETIQHSELGNTIHTHSPFRWVETSLDNITPTEGDEYKLALIEDSVHILISVNPVQWVDVNEVDGGTF